MNHEAQIANLLYHYADLMDGGKLDEAAALFAHAKIQLGGADEPADYHAIRQTWTDFVILYPCGTPRTKHLISNPIIELDEQAMTARCRSTYTVLQSPPPHAAPADPRCPCRSLPRAATMTALNA